MKYVETIEWWCKMCKILKEMKRVYPVVDPNEGAFVME